MPAEKSINPELSTSVSPIKIDIPLESRPFQAIVFPYSEKLPNGQVLTVTVNQDRFIDYFLTNRYAKQALSNCHPPIKTMTTRLLGQGRSKTTGGEYFPKRDDIEIYCRTLYNNQLSFADDPVSAAEATVNLSFFHEFQHFIDDHTPEGKRLYKKEDQELLGFTMGGSFIGASVGLLPARLIERIGAQQSQNQSSPKKLTRRQFLIRTAGLVAGAAYGSLKSSKLHYLHFDDIEKRADEAKRRNQSEVYRGKGLIFALSLT